MPGAGELERLKAQVAAGCRILHMEGILNYSGHVSARVPGQEALLIHQFDDSRTAVRPEAILTVGFDGRPLLGSAPGKPPIEVFIHTEIYRARPDVQAVVHTHSELAALFTMVAEMPVQPMRSYAVRWVDGVPIHADPTHIETPHQGQDLARTLGHCNAALLRAHGGVLVAESVPAVLVDAVHFDENARAQVQAQALGRMLPLTGEELAQLQWRQNRDQHVAKLWRYYVTRARDASALDFGAGLL